MTKTLLKEVAICKVELADATKIYTAKTYIFRNGALRQSEKEFKTAVAAYRYLHKKMINYAGTTDATQTIEVYNGVTSTEIYRNDTNGGEERTTNAEIQKLIDAWNAEIDARIAAKESNAEIIACINDYIVNIDAATEVEEINVAELKEIEREIKYTHQEIFRRRLEIVNCESDISTLNLFQSYSSNLL